MNSDNNIGLIGGVCLGILLVVIVGGLVICTERVPVGYEGVIFNMSGGVQEETLGQGWHIVAPTKKIKLFTVGNEQLVLTKDDREGSESDDSFKVATSDDASLAVSFQMSYRFIPAKLTDTYKKFKGLDGTDIVENRVKTVLKSKISEVTTNYSMMDIYSGNRAKINDELTRYLNKEFGEEFGIEVIDASIIDTHPDDKLKAAINNRVEALQKKQQAKAEQETAKVEAETALIKAQNAAEVKIKKAEGEKKANDLLDKSLSDKVLRQQWIEKWNGKMPTYYGSNGTDLILDAQGE